MNVYSVHITVPFCTPVLILIFLVDSIVQFALQIQSSNAQSSGSSTIIIHHNQVGTNSSDGLSHINVSDLCRNEAVN